MRPVLEDIRLLKLAEHNEVAAESFLLEIAMRVVEDDRVRERLLELQAPSEAHRQRVIEHLDRLNHQLTDADRRDLHRAAVADVVEVEESAHAFYQRHAKDVHDPEVVRLFQDLARQEARHVEIARQALALLGGPLETQAPPGSSERMLRLAPRILGDAEAGGGRRIPDDGDGDETEDPSVA